MSLRNHYRFLHCRIRSSMTMKSKQTSESVSLAFYIRKRLAQGSARDKLMGMLEVELVPFQCNENHR